jgi:hypothetical protein
MHKLGKNQKLLSLSLMFVLSFLGGIIFWHGTASAAVDYNAAYNSMPFRLPDDQYGLRKLSDNQFVANPNDCGAKWNCYGDNYSF